VGVETLEGMGARIATALEAHKEARPKVKEIRPGLEDVFVELIR
jgi:hypothetical protein